METNNVLTAGALAEIKTLEATSRTEKRTMVLVTSGPHSKHYGFAENITGEFIRFRTLEGASLVVPWAPGTYVELLPAPIGIN